MNNKWRAADGGLDRDILHSVHQTLAEHGEVWISSGKYTKCTQAFFDLAGQEWQHEPVELGVSWEMPGVCGISNLDARKQNCLCWRMTRSKGNSAQAEAEPGKILALRP